MPETIFGEPDFKDAAAEVVDIFHNRRFLMEKYANTGDAPEWMKNLTTTAGPPEPEEKLLDGFTSELLALLDLIEVNDDASLASQRFDIAEKYGYEVKFGQEVSAELN